MAAETSPYIGKAYERLEYISADEEKRLEYEARKKAIMDHNYLIKSSQRKGMEEGLEQGAKALIEVCQEDKVSRERTLERLIQKLLLSPETAGEYLERYWPERKG